MAGLRSFSFALMFTAFFAGCSMESLERQGVLSYNNIDETSLSHIKQAGMLADGETANVYYDTTISLDGTESYLLTDKRVLHQKKGKVTAMNYSDVKDIQHKTVTLEGDVITVSDGKSKLVMTIAPLNGGDVFLKELKEKVAAQK